MLSTAHPPSHYNLLTSRSLPLFHQRWNRLIFLSNLRLAIILNNIHPCECCIQQFSDLLKSSAHIQGFWLFIYMSDPYFIKMDTHLNKRPIFYSLLNPLYSLTVTESAQAIKKFKKTNFIISQWISNFCFGRLFYHPLNHTAYSMNTSCCFSSYYQ